MAANLQRIPVIEYDGTPVPADSWDVTKSGYWVFQPGLIVEGGAGSVFLDWWGRMLQVPRNPAEADADYSKRILAEVIAPAITNKGMALLLDSMLGLTGTQVVEAISYYVSYSIRLNDDHRLNDGERFAGYFSFAVASLWNCFIVILPGEIPSGFTTDDINRLVDRRRAAGCRKIATITPTRTYTDI
jgi:hypothetical protein